MGFFAVLNISTAFVAAARVDVGICVAGAEFVHLLAGLHQVATNNSRLVNQSACDTSNAGEAKASVHMPYSGQFPSLLPQHVSPGDDVRSFVLSPSVLAGPGTGGQRPVGSGPYWKGTMDSSSGHTS